MMDRLATDRCLEVARELRMAAEETRRTLQASRDLVRRSREQSRSLAEAPVSRKNDPGPSKRLVDSLIEAYEAAEDEADPQTCQLLSHVINHVGRRIARMVGPRVTGIAVH